MGTKAIYRPKETWWEKVYLFEIARGMGITIRHLIRSWAKPQSKPTWEYPEIKKPVAERFRGRHRLKVREDGSPRCVACYCCQTVCPPQAIEIEAGESNDPAVEKKPTSFRVNLMRCIFCGMCQEACPKDAIELTSEYELARSTREQLVLGIDDLLQKPGKE